MKALRNQFCVAILLVACTTPAEEPLIEPIPEPQLSTSAAEPEPRQDEPIPFTLATLARLAGNFAWQGAGVSPATRREDGEILHVSLTFPNADTAQLSIDRLSDGVALENGVEMRAVAATCDGCYDLVGEGEWGIVRVRIEGLPRDTRGPIEPKLVINFGGKAGMPVQQIQFEQK